MLSTHTLKSNLMFGTFSEKCSGGKPSTRRDLNPRPLDHEACGATTVLQPLPKLSLISHPFCFGDFSVLVDVSDLLQRVPDLLEQGLGDFILGVVDLPAAHVADLVLGPQEVVVGQVAVVVQVWNQSNQIDLMYLS